MSTRWERFSGDTSTFAVKVSFRADPDEGRGTDPDTAASWGSIQIWVDGVNVCAHVDQGETLQASHWYLLPILEWLASSWDWLLHEERLPRAARSFETGADLARATPMLFYADAEASQALEQDKQRYEWEQRHSLRAAREGGLFPDVRFRRLRDWVEVSWYSTPLAGANDIEFLTLHGRSCQEPVAVAHALYEVLSESVEWLAAQEPASARFNALRAAVDAIRSPERADNRTAMLAGLEGVGTASGGRWRSLVDNVKQFASADAFAAIFRPPAANAPDGLVLEGSCEAALLFGSASPEISEGDALCLARLLLRQYASEPSDGLEDLVGDEPPSADLRAWDQGYDLAEAVLDVVGTELVEARVEIEAFLHKRDVHLTEVGLSDRHIRAISFAGPNHAPTIAINKSSRYQGYSSARRFTLAHELCHLLFDRSRGLRLAVASGPWAPKLIEQRANAFAAMLLMPPELLATAMHNLDARPDLEGMRRIASQLGVGVRALLWHAHNIGFIDEVVRDELQAGLDQSQ